LLEQARTPTYFNETGKIPAEGKLRRLQASLALTLTIFITHALALSARGRGPYFLFKRNTLEQAGSRINGNHLKHGSQHNPLIF